MSEQEKKAHFKKAHAERQKKRRQENPELREYHRIHSKAKWEKKTKMILLI